MELYSQRRSMIYHELYDYLKNRICFQSDSRMPEIGLEVYNFEFESQSSGILPGEAEYYCPIHDFRVPEQHYSNHYNCSGSSILDVQDSHIPDNVRFHYHIFKPAQSGKSRNVILFFHGFNEKNWDKYYPWAYHLMKTTGKTIILFPLAFHMNRAPREWSDRRLMNEVSKDRTRNFPDIIGSSLVNAAISTRLHIKPQRFIWSGIQSYYDVIRLVDTIRNNTHPLIDSEAEFDFFAYSIGGLLAQTLMMTNQNYYFDRSRMVLFCSGAVFNRLSPVCRFIMDSETEQALYNYIVRYLETHIRKDAWLGHFLSQTHIEGWNFLSLLNYNQLTQYREEVFNRFSDRVYAVALEKDSVIPTYEVVNTLQGRTRKIPIRVDCDDFPYDYKHEDPFPLKSSIQSEVDRCYRETFDKLGHFLT